MIRRGSWDPFGFDGTSKKVVKKEVQVRTRTRKFNLVNTSHEIFFFKYCTAERIHVWGSRLQEHTRTRASKISSGACPGSVILDWDVQNVNYERQFFNICQYVMMCACTKTKPSIPFFLWDTIGCVVQKLYFISIVLLVSKRTIVIK